MESLGIELVGGSFRLQETSFCTFDAAMGFDAEELFEFGESVTLAKDGAAFFKGKIQPITKTGNPDYEGHAYALEDAWADLEATIYQEAWAIGGGSYLFPKAVLGRSAAGEPITIAEQISAVVAYAISVGVDLQMGSVPTGAPLWPQEVSNVSCAEVIRMSLRFHPDWIPWINHATTPPTLNVTAVSALTPWALATDGSSELVDFQETRRDDLLMDSVRIIYEFATTIDGEVFRNAVIDKWPVLGPDGGPRVVCVTVPLAGQSMQVQKSRVHVRPIPESGETSSGDAKKWVRAKYLHMAEVPDGEFTITEFQTSLWAEPDAGLEEPDPVSEQAPKIAVGSVADLPNELLEGSIEDWMRRKTGYVKAVVNCVAASGASAATKEAIAKGFPPVRILATNATSRIYKGLSQWSPEEEVPEGIAQAYYTSVHAAFQFSGSATLVSEEVINLQGRKLTLVGASTDSAPVTEISWDVASGRSQLTFGITERLAPLDLLEIQRNLRAREVTWWSTAERASDEIGAADNPSAAGDTVTGYHVPSTLFEPAVGVDRSAFAVTTALDGSTWKATVRMGYVSFLNPKSDADPVLKYWIPDGLDADPAPTYTVEDGDAIFCRVVTDNKGVPTAVTIEVNDPDTATVHYQPPPEDPVASVAGNYYYKLAEFELVGSKLVVIPFQSGGPIAHIAQLWEGENIGSGSFEIYKQRLHTGDSYEFRKLEQLAGGEALLKPFEGDHPDQIQFKALAERSGEVGIVVETDGDLIRIKGTDYDGTVDLGGGGSLTVVDGLIESATDAGSVGDTFMVRVWSGTLSTGHGTGDNDYGVGSTPSSTIWFLGGIAHLTEPVDFPTEGFEIIDVAWVEPVVGGPS